jgi:exopolysaccharide biosynthesis polyprenyl glycosylphosphotransferase
MKPRGRFAGRRLLMTAGDAAVGVGTFALVVLTRRALQLPGTTGRLPASNVSLEAPWLLGVALSVLVALSLAGTYDEPASSVKERGGLLISSLLAAAFLVLLYFSFGRAVPRTVLLIWAPVVYLALELWRTLVDRMAPIGVRPVLVLGRGEDARRAAAALGAGEITGHTLLEWRQDLTSFRLARPGGELAPEATPDGEVEALFFRNAPLDVIFASELPEDRVTLVALLERSLEHDFDLWILPGLTDIVASRVVTSSLGDLPLTPVTTQAASLPARALRRSTDLVLGSVLLVLVAPLLVLSTAAVALESRGAPWIRQRRVGRGGRVFELWKIRTMYADAEAGLGPTLTEKNDERLTRVGTFLRRARLDELPQLLHVVGGTMSLIGPRPERPEFVEDYVRQVPAYRLRHILKPGLTGLAQVMGAYATKPDVKLRYDLGYVFHWSPLLDVFILLRTVVTVLRGSGV